MSTNTSKKKVGRPALSDEEKAMYKTSASITEALKDNSKIKSVRLQLTLKPKYANVIEYCKKNTEATNYSDVIREALDLYQKAIFRIEQGKKIVAINEDGTQEILVDEYNY